MRRLSLLAPLLMFQSEMFVRSWRHRVGVRIWFGRRQLSRVIQALMAATDIVDHGPVSPYSAVPLSSAPEAIASAFSPRSSGDRFEGVHRPQT